MQYVLVFLVGIITFISPCLLPMLPIYLSFFAGGEANNRRAVVNALGFVLGFTVIFMALGAFAGTLGALFREYSTAVNIVTGSIVILFGLNYMGVLKIEFLNRTWKKEMFVEGSVLRFPSAFLFGLVFSIGWTPCVGVFLGSALMKASSQGSVLGGMLMLLLYSLGLGIPFVASAILMDRMKGTFEVIKKHYRVINIASGSLLVLVGILMATGVMNWYLGLFV